MRELLYVSEEKLDRMFLNSGRLSRLPAGTIDTSVGVLGANAKVSASSRSSDSEGGSESISIKLERVIRFLERTHHPGEFTNPNLQPNQWISFDIPMKYGTVHEDSAPQFSPSDVILFGGSTHPKDSKVDARSVEILLCGSVQHLRTHVVATGRMGSDTTWLHDVIAEIERRDQLGVHVVPEFLTELVPSTSPEVLRELAAHAAHGSLMRSSHPSPVAGRVRGLARVLMDIDNPRWVTRMVLATPLYVEIPPPDKIRRGPLQIFRKFIPPGSSKPNRTY